MVFKSFLIVASSVFDELGTFDFGYFDLTSRCALRCTSYDLKPDSLKQFEKLGE